MTRLIPVLLIVSLTTAACSGRAGVAAAAAPEPLRVCADPNNLPFSNDRGEGFENKLAQMLARDLGTSVEYTWWAQRRGFMRNTLNAQRCDVVMGYASDAELAATTKPYYRSTYVFVTRHREHLRIRSFDDPLLRKLRIGVQLIGDDGANSPPAHALSRRHLVNNIVGYSVYGDYRSNSPPSAIISAVARGDVDVAAAWGPMAGYFASREREPLDITPVPPSPDGPSLPQTFSISMATRRREPARLARLNQFIDSHRQDIDRLLDDFHVPRVAAEPSPARER